MEGKTAGSEGSLIRTKKIDYAFRFSEVTRIALAKRLPLRRAGMVLGELHSMHGIKDHDQVGEHHAHCAVLRG